MQLTGKVFVITGAESGIGKAAAVACAQAGAHIVAAGLNANALSRCVAELCDANGANAAIAVPTDVRIEAQVEALFKKAQTHFGGIDGVLANAGIIGTKTPAIDGGRKVWDEVMEVNLTGTYLTIMAAAKILIAQGRGGSLMATGSSSALRTVPGLMAYAASKGAVHTMMQALAVELGPYKIRVNTLVPGTTETDATRALPGRYLEEVAKTLPMLEVVQPEELGQYVAFAFSDAMPHLTGALLKCDAGRTIA